MSVGRRTRILTPVGVAVIMLVVGVAVGSVVLPMTKSQISLHAITTTESIEITTTQTVVAIGTTTQSVMTTSTVQNASPSFLFFYGNNLSETPRIIGNSSVTLDCNDSSFTFSLYDGFFLTMNLTIDGDRNQILVDSGQLNVVINGNGNWITSMGNNVILSEQLKGIGNYVTFSPPYILP